MLVALTNRKTVKKKKKKSELYFKGLKTLSNR